MKLISYATLLTTYTIVQAAEEKKDVSVSCMLFDQLSYYDVRGLKSDSLDYAVQDDLNKDVTYYFNLCAQTQGSCAGPAVTDEIFAYRKDAVTGKCEALTDFSLSTLEILEGFDARGYEQDFLQIKFGASNKKTCVAKEGDAPRAYQFTLDLICDADVNSTSSWFEQAITDTNDPCSPKVKVRHAKACPVFSASRFSKFFMSKPFILGIVFVIFGMIIAIQGRKFFPLTIFAIGTLAGFGITMLLFTMLSMFESARVEDKGGKLELTVIGTTFTYLASISIGIFLGFILKRMLKIGASIIGFVGGYLISIPLINLLFGWINSETFLSILSFAAALFCAYLSLRQYDNILIFGTSVLGSYLFVRGFSLFIDGSFPPESEIFERISTGDLPSLFYVYLAVFTILVALGTFFQRNQLHIEQRTNFIKAK
jgi:hypothetical protein